MRRTTRVFLGIAAAGIAVNAAAILHTTVAKACSWSTTNYSAAGAIVQDPIGTSCTAYGDTYPNGPGSGINGNGFDPKYLIIAPHFFGTPLSHLGMHALGHDLASDGNDSEILFYRDDQTTNGCSGWRSEAVRLSSSLQARGLSSGAGGNLVAWQFGDSIFEHDVLFNASGTENWFDLTLGMLLNGSGTPPAALSTLLASGAVISPNYALDATFPVVPLIDDLPGGGCNIAGDGPPNNSFCIQLYQSAGCSGSPCSTSWDSTYGGSTNPGAAQIAVDKTTTSDNLYALDPSGQVWNWTAASSWGSPLSQNICGSGGTESVTAIEIAAKGTKVYAIQALAGSITCPNTCPDSYSVFEYTTSSGCWTLLNSAHMGSTVPTGVGAIATDNSATYGAAVWATSGGIIYACY